MRGENAALMVGSDVWWPAMCGDNADLVVASGVWREGRFRVRMGGGPWGGSTVPT